MKLCYEILFTKEEISYFFREKWISILFENQIINIKNLNSLLLLDSRKIKFPICMNINDASVLEMINNLIASDRLNKNQILHIVNLASISSSIKDLKENMNWEYFKSKY